MNLIPKDLENSVSEVSFSEIWTSNTIGITIRIEYYQTKENLISSKSLHISFDCRFKRSWAINLDWKVLGRTASILSQTYRHSLPILPGSSSELNTNWNKFMLVYYNLDFQDLVVFNDDDPASIGRPCPNIYFRTRVACSKSSKNKLLAQFPFKRHGNELCTDFDRKSGLGFLVVFSLMVIPVVLKVHIPIFLLELGLLVPNLLKLNC